MTARVHIIDRTAHQTPAFKRTASNRVMLRIDKAHIARVMKARRELDATTEFVRKAST